MYQKFQKVSKSLFKINPTSYFFKTGKSGFSLSKVTPNKEEATCPE